MNIGFQIAIINNNIQNISMVIFKQEATVCRRRQDSIYQTIIGRVRVSLDTEMSNYNNNKHRTNKRIEQEVLLFTKE